jgi:hypothetical protein
MFTQKKYIILINVINNLIGILMNKWIKYDKMYKFIIILKIANISNIINFILLNYIITKS